MLDFSEICLNLLLESELLYVFYGIRTKSLKKSKMVDKQGLSEREI